MRKYKHVVFIGLIITACFALDLITKIIADNSLVTYEKKEVITNFFNLTLCYNTG